MKALGLIFKKPGYLILFAGVSFLTFFVSLWLTNRELLAYILFSDNFSFQSRVIILVNSLAIIKTNFTPASRVLVIVLSLLVGINLAVQVYYCRQWFSLQKKVSSLSLLSLLVGFLGVGCAACGSVVLSSLFGFSAAAVFLGFLPLQGLEFGLFGVFGLSLSTYLMVRKIDQNFACRL